MTLNGNQNSLSKLVPIRISVRAKKELWNKDYGMEEGMVKIKVRQAFLFYLLKQLGLDAGHYSRQPMEQHIVLLNREEIEEKLERGLWP